MTNSRYQSGQAAGLSLATVSRLKLKWAFGFEGDIIAFAQPTILDDQNCGCRERGWREARAA